MKITKGKILAFALALVLASGVLTGCELVSVNVDKDMAQKVATVQITGENGAAVEGIAAEDIYKKEIIEGFISYGYYYVNNGYTADQVYELILNNLTNNKVIVQYARSQLTKTYTHEIESCLNLPADNLLTEYGKLRVEYIKKILPLVKEVQLAEAAYNAKNLLKSYLDTFDEEEEDDDEEVEDESVTAHTVPTVDEADGTALDEEYIEAYEDELDGMTTIEELEEGEGDGHATVQAYDQWRINKFTTLNIAATTTSRKQAVSEFITTFTDNGLIPADEKALIEKNGDRYTLTNYSYYLDLLTSNLESFIITNYEDLLTEQAESEINTESLWGEYKYTYETQKASYTADISAYETALDGKTKDSYILYDPNLGSVHYGYVANILIGFSSEASAAIDAFEGKALSETAKREYRNSFVKSLVATDQRATWLQNGYYEKDDEGNYSFGDDYVKTDAFKQFLGTFDDNTDYEKTTTVDTYFLDGTEWKWGEKTEEDFKADFTNIVPNEYLYDKFYKELFVGKFKGAVNENTQENVAPEGAEYAYAYINSGKIDLEGENGEYNRDLIDDLHFTFSTDTGILSKQFGYLYSPKTSSTQYVPEFAEAAMYAVEGGAGTYYAVVTDYGVHIIICLEKIIPSVGFYGGKESETDAKAAFQADLDSKVKDSVAYRFRKAKIDANIETIVSDTVTYSISKYVDENNGSYAIKKYEKSLKNLLSSAS